MTAEERRFRNRIKELGYILSKEELNTSFAAYKKLGDKKKSNEVS